jgi:LysM domain
MKRHDLKPALAAAAFSALAVAGGDARAQDTAPAPAAPAPAAPAAPVAPAGPPPIYGVVAPPPPGVPVGGGNATESSSRPVSGDSEDHFDYGGKSSTGTAYGDSNGPVFFGGESSRVGGGAGIGVGGVPYIHVVRRGDTLWGICDQYFQNPYQWPRIWSYNAQLQNPHWIYPGDQIRLQSGNAPAAAPTRSIGLGEGNLVERRRTVAPDTVFLRDEGYVDDEKGENWGEISGAPEDHMLLTDFDHIYMRVTKLHDVKVGQELTIYRPTRQLGTGAIVQIQGTVRIDQWDAKDRIARGQIVETLDAIERGARIGPIRRRFDVVPPVRNDSDTQGQVIASVRLHEFFGQNQVVFIDRGAEDGLKIGNRLFVVRRGDAWRATLPTELAGMRIAVESQSPAEIDRVPHARDEGTFPEQVIGELRVLALHPRSATCVLTQSVREVELGDVAVARKGY